MRKQKIFRFAPSPNGFLHLGHAYSALLNYQYAKKTNGKFILRIEDIDIGRTKDIYIQAIYEDLHWLGIKWESPIMLQSERFDIYKKFSNKLHKMGLVYPCFCSRKEIINNAISKDPDGAPLYAKTCKKLNAKTIAQNIENKMPFALRLDMDKATQITGNIEINSAQINPLATPKFSAANPKNWGDVVIVRKNMPSSYHLSVVIDDEAQNITHVIRGKDLKKATDIHVILQKLLGLASPIYFHHKLITDKASVKLAKSNNSLSLRDLRKRGISAQEIIEQFGFDDL